MNSIKVKFIIDNTENNMKMNMKPYMSENPSRCNDTSPLPTIDTDSASELLPDTWYPFTSSLQYSDNENESSRNDINIDSNRLSLPYSTTGIGIEISTAAITSHLPVL